MKVSMKIKVELSGRDLIEVECEGDSPLSPGPVKNVSLLGCSHFMKLIKDMRSQFGNDISKWPIPNENDHSSLLLKEMILKLNGKWKFPYEHEELCHCRSISAHTVDQAVIAGAHTPEVVTRQTSVSSACGTCKWAVEKIIDFRLKR